MPVQRLSPPEPTSLSSTMHGAPLEKLHSAPTAARWRADVRSRPWGGCLLYGSFGSAIAALLGPRARNMPAVLGAVLGAMVGAVETAVIAAVIEAVIAAVIAAVIEAVIEAVIGALPIRRFSRG